LGTSHQFEEEVGAASSENGRFIAKDGIFGMDKLRTAKPAYRIELRASEA
jgi:hypothetical protein